MTCLNPKRRSALTAGVATAPKGGPEGPKGCRCCAHGACRTTSMPLTRWWSTSRGGCSSFSRRWGHSTERGSSGEIHCRAADGARVNCTRASQSCTAVLARINIETAHETGGKSGSSPSCGDAAPRRREEASRSSSGRTPSGQKRGGRCTTQSARGSQPS